MPVGPTRYDVTHTLKKGETFISIKEIIETLCIVYDLLLIKSYYLIHPSI